MLLQVVGSIPSVPTFRVLPSRGKCRAGSGGKKSERDRGAASIKRQNPAKTESPCSFSPELPPFSVMDADSGVENSPLNGVCNGETAQVLSI